MAKRTSAAVDKVYNYLYNGILSGDIPLGSPIPELELSKQLGLSRSPVREALNRMEGEGLVSHYVGRGTFVTDITTKDLEEIFELRIMFELHSLPSACRYMDDEMFAELENAFESLDENSTEQQYFDANNLLHSSIISYGGNLRLEKFYNMLLSQFAIVNRISARDPEHFKISRSIHLKIVRAMKEHNVELAQEFLKEHLLQVRERTILEYNKPLPAKARAQNMNKKK
ncbi:MAG TPA: GntR family transcriptional regulator [Candidatus Dorea gallistercoris]|uniref:GntR family transcriptional regulator n=1 Tax=Candidatus Dorea gallistercoris TaxID=2838542 RepID=A0A9D1UET1_9FIRM|nr:GntR family transcriptional regulator [Candidatus Dorea gallistercoris]